MGERPAKASPDIVSPDKGRAGQGGIKARREAGPHPEPEVQGREWDLPDREWGPGLVWDRDRAPEWARGAAARAAAAARVAAADRDVQRFDPSQRFAA